MIRMLVAAVAAFGFAQLALSQAPPKDRQGCVDSKVLSRMPGCFIQSCQSPDYNVGQFQVKGADNKVETQKVEGASE